MFSKDKDLFAYALSGIANGQSRLAGFCPSVKGLVSPTAAAPGCEGYHVIVP